MTRDHYLPITPLTKPKKISRNTWVENVYQVNLVKLNKLQKYSLSRLNLRPHLSHSYWRHDSFSIPKKAKIKH